MSSRPFTSFVDLFRTDPVASSLLGLCPLGLAIGQLCNSYVNGVSPLVSIAFAVTMVAFAVVATGHHAAERRLRRLDPELEAAN